MPTPIPMEIQTRKAFSTPPAALPLPDLLEVQKRSYEWFLKEGLKELFEEVTPIKDFTTRDFELSFGEYYLDDPKFNETTSRAKNVTFEAPLRVMCALTNRKTGEVREQEVYLGDFPLMTERGTFIVNGIERVVVSQLIRSAGVFFTSETVNGRRYYGAKIIPNRGAWLEIETDQNGVLWVKIDRKRKVAITALLRAFGYGTDEEIRALLGEADKHPDMKFVDATLAKDVSKSEPEGLIEVYKRIRPGDLATIENARSLIHSMFFRFDRYDFGRVGRYKLNQRFGFEVANTHETRILRPEDLGAIVREVMRLNISQEEADDIDHLGNRRVRAVGELVQNKVRVGLARMERIVKDRMSTFDPATMTPNRLVNARPVIGVVREFFMSSQLSQFMDQHNPLAELEHKRRLSAMGPGGLARERASFEVRDVHPTHYGRICPIATPEGPNIGLVGHLSSFAHVNDYGFIETPFRRVVKEVPNKQEELVGNMIREDVVDNTGAVIAKVGEVITAVLAKAIAATNVKSVAVKPRVSQEIFYLDAFTEERHVTTAATTPVDDQGYFVNDRVEVRRHGQPGMAAATEVDFMDVSSNQIISISTSLIPFVEHDDAARALMGTNMQRQAVPCITPQAPIVGTGVEARAARDSGQVIVAPVDGEITSLTGNAIELTPTSDKTDVQRFTLNKFARSNASTLINQRPVVSPGQKVKAGDVLADGPATEGGELALGQNVLVAFMPWDGYNYEDAIIISERLVQQDRYTSIHIENYPIEMRDTKLGPEVITADIPNVSEDKLKDLDENGIIKIGAEVQAGDILVGKITPKGETELSAEEKLLRALFGDKARDVRDSSLTLEHGARGKVVDIRIFSRDDGDKLPAGVIKSIQVSVATMRKVQVGDKMAGRHGNKGVISRVVPVADMPYMEDGTPVDIILSPLGVISRMNLGQLLETHLGFAAKRLGYKVMTPPLAGVTEEEIVTELKRAGLPDTGKVKLFDGRSGDAFANPITVGYIYMLKLNHMVDDKIHQRSIGPYSLVTQQPLGGKAQFGGQRFGEMEVWALEGYGAAHTLQEILTIKSDDVIGRSKAYESIIKGVPIRRLNVPESFHVLVRELKGLGLEVELLDQKGEPIPESELSVLSEHDRDRGEGAAGGMNPRRAPREEHIEHFSH